MNHRPFVILAILVGQAATAQNQPSARREFPLEVPRTQCLEFTELKRGDKPENLRECRISEFGEFGSVDRQTYYYALYCLIQNFWLDKGNCSDAYHRERGLAVFVGDPSSGNASLLFERTTGEIDSFRYEKPQIVSAAAGTLLYLPIIVDETGHYNESEYFVRDGNAWVPIEAEAWLADLGRRIPAGLGIWKGVWPDLLTMTAEAGLYRPRDSNCCPTGGVARIRLAIRSRQFVIESVEFEEAR